MGSAFHQLCPRYSGTLTPTAPTAIRLWDTFTFYSKYLCDHTAHRTSYSNNFYDQSMLFFSFAHRKNCYDPLVVILYALV